MRSALLFLSSAAAAPMLVACAANVSTSAEGADAEAVAPATAIVVVKKAAGEPAQAVARFVRMRSGAVDDQTLRMLHATVELPALGTCESVGTRELAWSAPARAVRLADVGAVSLEASGARTALVPREVPDVADLVGGPVYTAQQLPAGAGTIVLRGGAPELDVAPFEIAAAAPVEPSEVRVSFVASGAELGWDPGSADDVVFVEIAGEGAPARCVFGDSGHALVPSASFGDEGSLTLHRVHRETFRAKGLDSGEIRFDFAKTVAYSHH
jgi:hypothetical protein